MKKSKYWLAHKSPGLNNYTTSENNDRIVSLMETSAWSSSNSCSQEKRLFIEMLWSTVVLTDDRLPRANQGHEDRGSGGRPINLLVVYSFTSVLTESHTESSTKSFIWPAGWSEQLTGRSLLPPRLKATFHYIYICGFLMIKSSGLNRPQVTHTFSLDVLVGNT